MKTFHFFLIAVLLLVLFSFSLSIALDDEVGFSLSIPQEIGEEFKDLFQSEKYAEAEALYLKTVKEPDANWLTLLKMKQGQVEEGMEYLKKQIIQAKTPDERKVAIRRAIGLANGVSPKLGMRFLDEFGKELEKDIDAVCSCARDHMFRGEFDKAEPLVMDVLNQSPQLTGRKLTNAENTMGMMVAELYAQGHTKEALKFFALLEEKYPKFRLDPGRQLLLARIMIQDGRGMEALKKIDWVMETFPDHCKKNPDVVLLDKAQAYEAVQDVTESKKLLEEFVSLAQKNPQYRGYLPMVEGKLRQYREMEEVIQIQRATMEAAMNNPSGLSEEELAKFEQPQRWLGLRIFTIVVGIVMICYALYRLRNKQ
jgi:tetratricopeptide (TPR) repeat protein